MPFFTKLFGRLMFSFGLMITVVGCVIGSMIGSAAGTTITGIILMAAGAALYWVGSTKICPQCAKRIKHAVLHCQHCGRAQA